MMNGAARVPQLDSALEDRRDNSATTCFAGRGCKALVVSVSIHSPSMEENEGILRNRATRILGGKSAENKARWLGFEAVWPSSRYAETQKVAVIHACKHVNINLVGVAVPVWPLPTQARSPCTENNLGGRRQRSACARNRAFAGNISCLKRTSHGRPEKPAAASIQP